MLLWSVRHRGTWRSEAGLFLGLVMLGLVLGLVLVSVPGLDLGLR